MVTTNVQTAGAEGLPEASARHAALMALDTASFARRTGTRVAEILEQVKREYPDWTLARASAPEHLA